MKFELLKSDPKHKPKKAPKTAVKRKKPNKYLKRLKTAQKPSNELIGAYLAFLILAGAAFTSLRTTVDTPFATLVVLLCGVVIFNEKLSRNDK